MATAMAIEDRQQFLTGDVLNCLGVVDVRAAVLLLDEFAGICIDARLFQIRIKLPVLNLVDNLPLLLEILYDRLPLHLLAAIARGRLALRVDVEHGLLVELVHGDVVVLVHLQDLFVHLDLLFTLLDCSVLHFDWVLLQVPVAFDYKAGFKVDVRTIGWDEHLDPEALGFEQEVGIHHFAHARLTPSQSFLSLIVSGRYAT